MNIGDKVKHRVGAMFAYTDSKGYLVGTVKAVYASDSYVLKTRGSEVLLTGINNAVHISDDEFNRTYHPSLTTSSPQRTTHSAPVQPESIKPQTTHKRSPPSKPTEGPTKAEMALEIYKRLMESNNGQHPSRAVVIKTFVEELSMTEAGASTYAYNTKKKIP